MASWLAGRERVAGDARPSRRWPARPRHHWPVRRPPRRRAGRWPGRAARSTRPARPDRRRGGGDGLQQRLGGRGCSRSARGQAAADRDERGEGGVRSPPASRCRARPASGRGHGEPTRIGDDQLVALEAQQAVGDEVGEQPVHGLARAADHPGQLGLGERPGQADLAAAAAPPDRRPGSPAARATSRRRWRASRPGRSRKWRSSTWAVSRRISAASDASSAWRRGGCSSTRRSNASRRRTSVGHRVDGDGRRRAWRAVEQGELAEEPAGPDRRQDGRLGAVVGGQGDLDLALGHDEQGIAGVAGVEHGLAPPEAARAEGRRRPGPGTRRRARRTGGRHAARRSPRLPRGRR